MEKKNTILLTTIAIITLLVAVVGATFAYYTVETKDSTSPITFTGNGNPVGAITLTSPNTTLEMTITPTDMADFHEVKKYYAIIPSVESEKPITSNGRYGVNRKHYIIAQADLVGGNDETAYTCTAQLTVTASGSMASVLKPGDVFLYLETDQTTIENSNTQTLDLSTIKDSPKVYNIIYTVNGLNQQNRVASINADIELNNTQSDQSYLAGESLGEGKGTAGSQLTVTIQSSEFKCSIDTSKATS